MVEEQAAGRAAPSFSDLILLNYILASGQFRLGNCCQLDARPAEAAG
jgi:hypothetical protein